MVIVLVTGNYTAFMIYNILKSNIIDTLSTSFVYLLPSSTASQNFFKPLSTIRRPV